MRYEDASQSGSSSSENPIARDDADSLPAGDRGPATGNVISGSGTQTGAAGADVNAEGAHIVSISGGHGSDSSFSGGKLVADGQFGRLSIDREGNYSYLANKGAPESSRDTFTYKLADASGKADSATLTIEIGKTPTVVQANAQRVVPGPDGVVVLPAGVELSDIHVVGRNLVIDLPNGGQMLIIDGAVFVPQLVLGDVEVPATSLAALLIGSELRPAAGGEDVGALQSGGGNFEVPVSPLDPGVPLGDLIPPTELAYIPPDFREVAIDEDDKPEILIQTPDQPAGAEDATARVFEEALPARPGEPAGSNSSSTAETTTGTIVYESDDTPNAITINGVLVTGVGQIIAGTFGSITITSVAVGEIGYSYTLADNTSGDNTSDLFTVVITDRDGDTDTATLTVSIVDDVPTARADADSVREDGPLVADGNVLTGSGGSDANATDGVADTPGADGITLTAIAFGSTNGSIGAPLAGAYGSLVIGANGGYVYTLNNQSAAVQALGVNETLTETFTYTITDGDGDVRSTTLTITINGANDAPTIVAGAAVVSEEGLAAGNPDTTGLPTDSTNSATATGQLTIGDVDGDALTVALGTPAGSLTSHGQPITWSVSSDGHVLTGSAGGTAVVTVTVTNSGSYSVALLGQVDHPNAGGEDILAIAVPVTLSDGTVSVSSTLTVSVEDDSPRVTSAPAVSSSVVIDETDGASPLSSGAPLVVTSGGAIITTGISFGADGPGTAVAYSLSLQGGTSIASGLQTALGDQAITLTATSATLITASYNGGTQTAFTIQMNADGSITVTQFTALEHLVDGSTPAAYDDALNLVLGDVSLVNATATYTDFDGDQVTATVGIGGAITFRDDGPAIDVTANAAVEAEVLLTTGDDGTEGEGSTSASTATGNFGGAFGLTFDVGADGAPTPSLSFALDATTAVSGLTSHGVAINLYNVGGVIVGSTAGTAPASATDASVVFAVSVDAGGIVTLTQYAQVDHPLQAGANDAPFADQLASLADGAITLTASSTIVDNDGDSASDSATVNIGANLRFADDGPDITASLVQGATIRIDETDGVAAAGGEVDPVGGNLGTVTMSAASLFTVSTVSPSADAPTTNSYALSISAPGVASGLLLSTTNESIVLVDNGGVMEGHVGNPAGAIAFTVSIDAGTGATTLTQYLAVEHFDTGSNDEDSSGLNAGVLAVNVTATDYDGDTDVASVDLGSIIRFEDDGPSIDVTANVELEGSVLLTTGDDGTEGAGSTSASTASGNFGGTFGLTFTTGSDGAATPSLSFALDATTAVSGLTSHGVAINLYNVGGVIVGSTAGTAPASATDASVVFAVSVDAGGIVTLTQYAQVDHPLQAGANDAPFADQLASLADGAITLTASSTIVDNDGDSASDSATVNIGANLRFADDGPDITASLVQGATIRIDETDGVAAAGGEVDPVGGNLGTVTMSAASLFTVSTVSPSADAPTTNSYALSISAPGVASGLLLSTTNESIVLVDNGGVIEGHVGNPAGAIAFTVSIDAGTGATTLTQYLAVEHFDTGSNDEDSSGLNAGVLAVNVTATDYDGDTDVASVDLGSIIRFEDDGPLAVNDTVNQIGENQPVTFGVFGNDIFGSDGVDTDNNPTVAVTFTQPPVGQGTVSYNAATGQFTFTPAAGQEGSTSFTYTITDGDGDPSTATVTINLAADSVPIVTNAVASVDDDGLSGGNPLSTTGDLAVPNTDGDNNEATFSGTFVTNFGGDTPGTFSLAAMNGTSGTVGTETVNYSYAGNVLTATGPRGVLFTVSVNPTTGAYTVTLVDNVLHAAGGNENDATAVLTFTATDSDNDSTNGTLTITFDDDAPTAANDTVGPVAENQSVTFGVFGNDAFGADGVDTDNNPTVAVTFTQPPVGQGTVSYNAATGQFTFTPAAGQEGSTSFTYTITDGDGDPSTATVTINLAADSVPIVTNAVASVDDDGLSGGNPLSTTGDLAVPNTDGDNNEATFSGTFVTNFGGDTPGTFSLAAMNGTSGTVGTETVNYSYAGNVLTATGPRGVLFTVSVNPTTGAYTVTLVDNVLHAAGGNENDATAVLTFTATDSDNDSTNGTLTITFDDDAPTAANDTVGPVAENQSVTFGVFGNDAFGADGVDTDNNPTVAVTFTQPPVGQGTVSYNAATGQFTFTPAAGQEGSTSFTYTITDGDGDPSTATVTINLAADSVPIVTNAVASVDDDGLSGGNPLSTTGDLAVPNTDGDNNEATFSGTFVTNFGGDTPGTFSLAAMNGTSGTVGTETVNYSYAGNVLTATGPRGVLFTVSVNPTTGAYTVTLVDNVLHAAGGNENDATAVLTFTATDSDNDSAPGTLTITFDDDAPTASVNSAVATDTLVLDETRPLGTETDGDSAPAGLASVTANFADNFASAVLGADGGTVAYSLVLSGPNVNSGLYALQPGDILTSDGDGIGQGAQIVLNQVGNVVTGAVGGTDYFRITIDASGNVTFEQLANIWHGSTASDDDTSTLTALANSLVVRQTVTDGDNDVAIANIDLSTGVFQIEDDGPNAFTTNAVVTTNGNTPPVHGTFNGFDIGTDGFGQLTFDPGLDGDPAMDRDGHNLFIGNQQLFLHVTGNVLTASTSGGTVGYTVTLNQNGSYDFDVNAVISNGTQTSFSNLTSTSAGNVLYRGVGADNPATPIDVLLSATAGGAPGTVNTDSDSVGSANQSVDAGESVRIDFVSLLTSGAATPTGFNYTNHVGGTNFTQVIPQVQGNQAQVVSFTVYALDTTLTASGVPDSNPAGGFSDSTGVNITSVTVTDYSSGNTSAAFNVSALAVDTPTLIAFGISVERNADGSVTFSGVQEGDSYSVSTGSNFDAIVVEQVSGSFDLGIFTLGGGVAGTPIVQDFGIVAIDADGDAQASTITATINQAAPAAGLAAVVDKPVATEPTPMVSSLRIDSHETQELRSFNAANSNLVLASAMAAVGLAATPLAAEVGTHASDGLQAATMQVASPVEAATVPIEQAAGQSLAGHEVRILSDDAAMAGRLSDHSPMANGQLTPDSNVDAHDMASLLAPSDGPADNAAAAAAMAPAVVIPSAEALEAMAAAPEVAGADHAAAVARVVSEALDGGAGGDAVDAALASLPHHGEGGNAALLALASQHGADVSGWDMGPDGHLSANLVTNIVMDMPAFHHDAVQPAING